MYICFGFPCSTPNARKEMSWMLYKENFNPRAPQWWDQFIADPGCISCPYNILVGAAVEVLAPEAHSAFCTHDLCLWHSCWQPGGMAHPGFAHR